MYFSTDEEDSEEDSDDSVEGGDEEGEEDTGSEGEEQVCTLNPSLLQSLYIVTCALCNVFKLDHLPPHTHTLHAPTPHTHPGY